MTKVTLKERVTFEYGYSVRVGSEKSGRFPVYGSNGATGYIDSYKVKGPGVIIGRKGSVGAIHYTDSDFTPTDTAYYLKLNDTERDLLKFWYYYLQLLGLNKLNTHSSVPGLSREIAYFIAVQPPAFDDQRRIADVLSSLDDKIELNNRINAELEAMAKTLYDYWFVQFDFQDANGKPYKSSGGKMVYNEALKRDIPKDWSVKTLSEITSLATGSVNPANFPDKIFKHLSIPSFDAVGSFFEERGDTIGSNKFKVCSTDILVSKLNPKFSRVIYVTNEEDLICSTEFVVWRPENQKLKPFLYSVAKDSSFISFCQQSASGTSNSHKRINPTVMMSYQIAYNQDVCEQFGKHVEASIKKLMINNLEKKQLTTLRDWLLPMLMNGQVVVK